MRLVAALIPVGLLALGLSGCATTDPATISVPHNYRQLVAHNLKTGQGYDKIVSAQISPPGVWVDPFGMGWDKPIACAQITTQGSFGPQTHYAGYAFKNGAIAETFYPESISAAAGNMLAAAAMTAATCGKLTYSSFPELGKR